MRIMAADAIDKGCLAAVKFLMGRLEPCIANFDCFFLDKTWFMWFINIKTTVDKGIWKKGLLLFYIILFFFLNLLF